MHIKLRSYQQDGIRLLYEKWRSVKKVVYWGATGSGKTEVICYLAQEAFKDNVPVVIVMRGRELVFNMSERLSRYNIDHSIYMADHYKFNKSKLIQVCSIDTLKSRKDYPYSKTQAVVILDEAHKNYDDIFLNYQQQFIAGITATPFSDMSKYDDWVCPIEPFELKSQGFLVDDIILCPHKIDTSSLSVVAGDFKRDQVAQLVTQGEIVGNVIKDYIEHGQSRPAVCFAVNVEHSKQLRDEFIKNGIPAVHCDASSTDEERIKAKNELENGSIRVLCNVDIFSVGWDCPMVSCVILARPTHSVIWYLQAIGRGLRSFPGKLSCIILDNAGNVYRHGTAYRPRSISLEKPQKKNKNDYKKEEAIRTCGNCFSIYPAMELLCPYCGERPPAREIKKIEGILREYSETEEEKLQRRVKEAQGAFYKLSFIARTRKLSNAWVRNSIKDKYGSEVLPYIDHLFKIRSGR